MSEPIENGNGNGRRRSQTEVIVAVLEERLGHLRDDLKDTSTLVESVVTKLDGLVRQFELRDQVLTAHLTYSASAEADIRARIGALGDKVSAATDHLASRVGVLETAVTAQTTKLQEVERKVDSKVGIGWFVGGWRTIYGLMIIGGGLSGFAAFAKVVLHWWP